MAKYNIYGHVLYSEIKYEELLHTTERIFINSLMNRVPSIDKWLDEIWDHIDHEYMIKTLEEIKRDVIRSDIEIRLRYEDMPIDIEEMLARTEELDDLFQINTIDRFKKVEKSFGDFIADRYQARLDTIDKVDEMEYLTKQIKKYSNLEQVIPYFNKEGDIVRKVTPSTYLSMLYNVNLTRTGWNQTMKDAEYFERDLVLLETHRNSCPHCAPMQGKIYSRSGKSSKYPNIEIAYSNGVGHPNCKCEWSIYWGRVQLENQYISETHEGDYKQDQMRKAIEREIRKQENDKDLYEMIGNYEESDKASQRIAKLKAKL